jgi:hypothetical protein
LAGVGTGSTPSPDRDHRQRTVTSSDGREAAPRADPGANRDHRDLIPKSK